MTERQKQMLKYIEAFKREHDFMPTYREIGNHCGLSSTASVNYQLQQLAAKGHIRIYAGRQRAITLIQKDNQ